MAELARLTLARTLRPLLPKGWKVEASSKAVDKINAPVVQLRQTGIARLQQGGGRVYAITFLATITAPHEGTQAAEDALDDGVLELVGALSTAGVMWSDCNKVLTSDQKQLAYDITITINAAQL